MATYSYQQIKDLWISQGGNPTAADTAAAIAMAESGGDAGVVSKPNPNGTIDRGLFQINSVHGILSTTDLAGNIRAAIMISHNGSDWTPWSTYWKDPKNRIGAGEGVFRKFLKGTLIGTSEIDIQQPGSTNPLEAIGSTLSGISDAFGKAVSAGTWFANPHNTIRIFLVVSGGAMSLIGIAILFRGTIEDTSAKVVQRAKVIAASAA